MYRIQYTALFMSDKIEEIRGRIEVLPLVGGKRIRPLENKDNDVKKKNQLFSHPYSNIALIAKKNSGKTSLINHILKRLANKKTFVLIVCPTAHKDPGWRQILDMLDSKDVTYETLSSYNETDEETSESAFDLFINYMQSVDTQDMPENKKPRFIIVSDDMGQANRDKRVASLMKKNRHLKLNFIISSQWGTDLSPDSISQIDQCFLSRGNNQQKLQHITSKLDIPIEFDLFHEIYKEATEKPYSFLRIDVRSNKYYVGFSHEIRIKPDAH